MLSLSKSAECPEPAPSLRPGEESPKPGNHLICIIYIYIYISYIYIYKWKLNGRGVCRWVWGIPPAPGGVQGLRVGWGGVKFLHIERKITSLVNSHPPKHVFLPTTWILMMFVHYPPFPHIFSWKFFLGCLGILCSCACRTVTLFFLSTHTWENSLVNICHSSSFETSWWFLRGAFSLGKRNEIRQGLAASHVNSHWLVNPRHIVPEKTQWKWTWGMWPDSCDARFLWNKQGMWERSAASHINLPECCTRFTWKNTRNLEGFPHVLVEKRYGIRERLVAGHMNLQSQGTRNARRILTEKTQGIWGELLQRTFFIEKHSDFSGRWREWHVNLQPKWSPGAFYTRKHNDFSGVGGSDIWIYSQNEAQAHFTRENTTISPGLAGVTYEFTGKMKRFLRGRWRPEEAVSINKEHVRWGDDHVPWTCQPGGCYASSWVGVGWDGMMTRFYISNEK